MERLRCVKTAELPEFERNIGDEIVVSKVELSEVSKTEEAVIRVYGSSKKAATEV